MPDLLEDNVEDILKKARTGKGLSLPSLAEITGMEELTLRRFEEGSETHGSTQLNRLAHALDLHKDRLQDIASHKWHPHPFPKEIEQKVITLKGYMGNYEVKGYLIMDHNVKEAVLIDTALNPDLVLETLFENGISLRAILLTHAHYDHMGGISKIRSATGAPIYIHPNEAPLYRQQEKKPPDHWVKKGLKISLGDNVFQALETPGHTPGGVSYRFNGYCFVGDALFAGSTGRSFSPEGYQTLLSSLRRNVLSLPGDTLLFPGHGPSTTVQEELLHNPFFI